MLKSFFLTNTKKIRLYILLIIGTDNLPTHVHETYFPSAQSFGGQQNAVAAVARQGRRATVASDHVAPLVPRAAVARTTEHDRRGVFAAPMVLPRAFTGADAGRRVR